MSRALPTAEQGPLLAYLLIKKNTIPQQSDWLSVLLTEWNLAIQEKTLQTLIRQWSKQYITLATQLSQQWLQTSHALQKSWSLQLYNMNKVLMRPIKPVEMNSDAAMEWVALYQLFANN